jgi:hypothetical protein
VTEAVEHALVDEDAVCEEEIVERSREVGAHEPGC